MAAIDWYKATLDFLKGNKVLLLVVAALLGVGGNIYQATSTTTPKIIVTNPTCEVCKSFIVKHIKEHH